MSALAAATPARALQASTPAASGAVPFSRDDLLWMEVRVDDELRADSIDVYTTRSGSYLPLGQLARILDLAIGVFPAQGRAEGWVLSQDRRLTIDLAAATATLEGRSIRLTPVQATLFDDDLYLRVDLIEALLPLRLRLDANAQSITITPREALPFQQRRQRAVARAKADTSGFPVLAADATPYRLFEPPAFDVNLGGQVAQNGALDSGRLDVRAAGDLAYASFEGYAGADGDGRLDQVRLALTRRDSAGRSLGPLGGVRVGVGDVYTPAAAIGLASLGGRGMFYSSAPLDALDLATPLSLRGALATGEEVELYVNETLQGAQTAGVGGRYEFLNIPLRFGLNTLRLVFYGPQGQRREEVRRLNLGAGQVAAGQVVVRLGAVEQGRPLIEVGGANRTSDNALRMVGVVDYGINPALTVSAGAGRYKPQNGEARTLAFAGLRGALDVAALQGDLAIDGRGASGVTLSVAARPFNIAVLGRHSEYSNGFVDETRQLVRADEPSLVRASDFRLDGSLSFGARAIPLTLDIRRLERADQTRRLATEARTSLPVGAYYLSAAVLQEADTAAPDAARRLVARIDATTLIARRLQLRAGVGYSGEPRAELESAYASADFQISPIQTLHLEVLRGSGPEAETSLQASHVYRAPWFDIGTNLGIEAHSRVWRLGLQLAFGFAYDPLAAGYRFTRPGVSTGGSAVINAYIDDNGDRRRQPQEAPVAGLRADTGLGPVVTDAKGQARIDNLADGIQSQLRFNAEAIDDPFLTGAPRGVTLTGRPGHVAVVDLPLHRSGEVELTALFRRDGRDRPLSALDVELIPIGGGEALAARSDHAGVLLFEGAAPGDYLVRLRSEQATALGLSMVEPVKVTVPAAGGYLRGGRLFVQLSEVATP